MNMEIVVFSAAAVSIVVCLAIGVQHSQAIKSVVDIFPVLLGRNARVDNHQEFAASTVATTISLATVIVAFYELAPFLGLWLLWPAITTVLGLFVFHILVPRVWEKMAHYEFRPTLHAYLGTEFGSSRLAFIASLFTAVGYVTAFAVELTVGAMFLGPLLPSVPSVVLVGIIAIVSFVYTGLGGFRTVIVTDRFQMRFIWLLLLATGAYYAIEINSQGITESFERIPSELISFDWHTERTSFVLGILVMNLLTYIGNMGLWQRIAGSQNSTVVTVGLWSSIRSAAISWTFLALAAIGSLMIVAPVPQENLMITVLNSMQHSTLGLVVIFCVVVGLLGALLSTASTQLMAVTHTIYEDLVSTFRTDDIKKRTGQRREVMISRAILVASAVLSVFAVEFLREIGFSVADMAFAVYGAALGLVPPILITLFVPRAITERLSFAATLAVTLGFLSCWCVATYGRIHGDGNMVFLSPIVSTLVATVVMLIGWAYARPLTQCKK